MSGKKMEVNRNRKIIEFACIFFDYDEDRQKILDEKIGSAVQVYLEINNPIIILNENLTKEQLLKNLSFQKSINLRKGVGYKGEVHRLVFSHKDEKENLYVFNTMTKKGRKLRVTNYHIKVSEKSLKYIYPLVLSPDLTEEGFKWSKNYVIFPYEHGKKQPVSQEKLKEEAPELYNYFKSREVELLQQSAYNKRIQNTKEFYGLIRVGKYTYANYYVCIRDNTKPNPCLVEKIETHWGEKKIPIFDNHISYLSFDKKEEAEKVLKKLLELEPLITALYDERSIGARLPFKLEDDT